MARLGIDRGTSRIVSSILLLHHSGCWQKHSKSHIYVSAVNHTYVLTLKTAIN